VGVKFTRIEAQILPDATLRHRGVTILVVGAWNKVPSNRKAGLKPPDA